jgi:hypothetical protein
LTVLWVTANNLSANTIQGISFLKQVTYLHLNCEQDLTEQEAYDFSAVNSGSFAHIRRLQLTGCGIDGKVLRIFQGSTLLKYLDLSKVSVCDNDLSPLSGLSSLEALSLFDCEHIEGTGLKYLTNDQIKYMYIWYSGVHQLNLAALQNLKSLQVFTFIKREHEDVYIKMIPYLVNLPDLHYLYSTSPQLAEIKKALPNSAVYGLEQDGCMLMHPYNYY